MSTSNGSCLWTTSSSAPQWGGFPGGITNGADWYVIHGGMQVSGWSLELDTNLCKV